MAKRALTIYVGLIILVITAMLWFTLSTMYANHTRDVGISLRQQAEIVGTHISDLFQQDNSRAIHTSLQHILPDSSLRIIVTNSSGSVIGDTRTPASLNEIYSDRTEIQAALSGQSLYGKRESYSQNVQIYFGVTPLIWDGTIQGSLRISIPVEQANQRINQLALELIIIGVALSALLILTGVWISQRFKASLEEITDAARQYAAGDLTSRISVNVPREISEASHVLNSIFDQFEERVEQLQAQHQELETILTNMTEALVLLDSHREVVRFNTAAEQMFDLSQEDAVGRKMMEIVRNTDVHEFIEKVYASDTPQRDEFVMFQESGRMNISIHGTPIRDTKGRIARVLIVFHDLTHIRKLENVRRDFMANVSHELKTPITSIKGALETLESGAISDKKATEEFLPMIRRHIFRLEKIIDNLLSLSQLEHADEYNQLSKEEYNIASILDSAVKLCRENISEAQVDIRIECPEELTWDVNAALLEEAVLNLLENAVKYSKPSELIQVVTQQSEDELIISVQDSGIGIPQEDLSRVFERFYRVEKGRSRDYGGTGLGLAIVKHIARAHGGSVSVKSKVNYGSTFFIQIPSD